MSNLDLARPILWASIALVGLTGAGMFARFLMLLGLPADGEQVVTEPEPAGS